MPTICPICKKSNFFKVVSNCKENIRLTEKTIPTENAVIAKL